MDNPRDAEAVLEEALRLDVGPQMHEEIETALAALGRPAEESVMA
jgi:hypothetical protein